MSDGGTPQYHIKEPVESTEALPIASPIGNTQLLTILANPVVAFVKVMDSGPKVPTKGYCVKAELPALEPGAYSI